MAKQSSEKSAFGADSFRASAEAMKNFKLPGIDMEAAMASHRRNMEALTTAQQTVVETMKNIGKLQSEYFRKSIEDMNSLVKQSLSPVNSAQKVESQSESLKQNIERTTQHSKELNSTLSHTQAEIINLAHRRLQEGVDEAREIFRGNSQA